MHEVYFDCSSDRPLKINLQQLNGEPLQEVIEPLFEGRERPATPHTSEKSWTACEVLVGIMLAALTVPSVIMYLPDAAITLFLEATLTPLTRHGRYAGLLHLTLLASLLLHVRGRSDVTILFCIGMLLVYVDHALSNGRRHENRQRRRVEWMHVAFSVVQVLVAWFNQSETVRRLNAIFLFMVALHFNLTVASLHFTTK